MNGIEKITARIDARTPRLKSTASWLKAQAAGCRYHRERYQAQADKEAAEPGGAEREGRRGAAGAAGQRGPDGGPEGDCWAPSRRWWTQAYDRALEKLCDPAARQQYVGVLAALLVQACLHRSGRRSSSLPEDRERGRQGRCGPGQRRLTGGKLTV